MSTKLQKNRARTSRSCPIFYSKCSYNYNILFFMKSMPLEPVTNCKQDLMTVYTDLGCIGDIRVFLVLAA